MARWTPGARERLQQAALDLFATHGYDKVTVAEIAEAAGVTERTFFRHFDVKREVLFIGQDEFAGAFLTPIGDLPDEQTDPGTIVLAALAGACDFFPDDRRPFSRARDAIIDAEPALQERELLKLAGLTDSLTRAMSVRGIDPQRARLAAETATVAFRTTFATWIADGENRSFRAVLDSVLADLTVLADGMAAHPPIS
ncbi:TetR/AcrR family transcriptional regulator [Gordonia soli]|uniref:Putative TetR family transcriptional regulator n=1 Tax=Gordonia soli NBRC 108243 TaxID=1223545 RepID=M0QD16_9ACTN|nr:TetR/AcrR family transcriptional regulator [Gordonia soli]GAC66503.1 putative TetR family transcriptional regulator [Gordonia soli NBRC 108243]